ncbi:MAG: hypothetical protein HDQ88_08675 [Clostridia bacterium]|nr:hypothetical protein [Clostridia bacterium]
MPENKTFEITAQVTGYVTLTIDAPNESDAIAIFNQNIENLDFGPLTNVDWCETSITPV